MTELGIVKRNITRADKTAVDKLGRFGVATVHEAMGRVGLMQRYMRPIYSGVPVSGSMPRTAPIISDANKILSTGMTLVNKSMPGW